jgi:hypothetical protein
MELCSWMRYRPFGFPPARCVNADAATDFTAADDFGLLNSLAALDATRAEVCSLMGFLVTMEILLTVQIECMHERESGVG